ncbi:serine dehydrogenasease [Pseudobutyrivibrio xylanivorans]|uniref:Serine dehydrogenasease n=2 Tax=Pseudobutyrivibrio xylanivorans TaxID=185007 RepID=A0A5P6VW84_PSEXY|nr:serine dehydrogenasease [Pseudobutyrivibrio xylanivorans]
MIDDITELERIFEADFLYIDGPISAELNSVVVDEIGLLRKYDTHGKLCIMLTTNGGDANSAERLVNVFRHNYDTVYFIIPDYAYSAGTILCMSGDKIFMNYNSVLGPIDPQVQNKEGRFVPALGYLDKIDTLLEAARDGSISQAEFLILKDFDLAELSLYEQARDLTVDLLKDWLVKYKFKDWTKHKSTGKEVSVSEKENRAKEIAEGLGNYKRWKAHGRPLNIETLRNLKLIIDDFSDIENAEKYILSFYSMAREFKQLSNMGGMTFTREGRI